MAWRPSEELIAGELDNTTPGKVTGWLTFVGLADKVKLELTGDFHRDIRGTVIRLSNPSPSERRPGYLEGFCLVQRGKSGDITAGRPPRDYVDYPYIEWYAENGRWPSKRRMKWCFWPKLSQCPRLSTSTMSRKTA